MAEMDMGAGAPGGEEGTGAAPYMICINVDANGKMSVGVEAPEADEMEGMEPKGMPAPSARDAISMVMDIIKSGGKMPDSSGDDEFNKGFGKPQDGPMLDKMKPESEYQ